MRVYKVGTVPNDIHNTNMGWTQVIVFAAFLGISQSNVYPRQNCNCNRPCSYSFSIPSLDFPLSYFPLPYSNICNRNNNNQPSCQKYQPSEIIVSVPSNTKSGMTNIRINADNRPNTPCNRAVNKQQTKIEVDVVVKDNNSGSNQPASAKTTTTASKGKDGTKLNSDTTTTGQNNNVDVQVKVAEENPADDEVADIDSYGVVEDGDGNAAEVDSTSGVSGTGDAVVNDNEDSDNNNQNVAGNGNASGDNNTPNKKGKGDTQANNNNNNTPNKKGNGNTPANNNNNNKPNKKGNGNTQANNNNNTPNNKRKNNSSGNNNDKTPKNPGNGNPPPDNTNTGNENNDAAIGTVDDDDIGGRDDLVPETLEDSGVTVGSAANTVADVPATVGDVADTVGNTADTTRDVSNTGADLLDVDNTQANDPGNNPEPNADAADALEIIPDNQNSGVDASDVITS